MPYRIIKDKNKYKVVKKGDDSKVFGTHDSKKKALSQIRAIEMSENLEN